MACELHFNSSTEVIKIIRKHLYTTMCVHGLCTNPRLWYDAASASRKKLQYRKLHNMQLTLHLAQHESSRAEVHIQQATAETPPHSYQ
jgi:hypothetical protein